MAKLDTYPDFFCKRKFFTVISIDSKQIFDKYYLEWSQNDSGIWRGVNESSYRIYTSLQRYWIENELDNVNAVIREYLQHIYTFSIKWNNSCIQSYFENLGFKDLSVLSFLSILRHHGTPTPLLDWTYDPKIALYFACREANMKPSNDSIEHYCSLYKISFDHPYYSYNIKNELDQISPHLFFEALDKGATIFKIEDKDGDKFNFLIKNNFNITNQKGLFIVNASSRPLEEAIIYDLQNRKLSSEKFEEKRNFYINNFIAFEIHKRLKLYILHRLAEDGITDNSIYPDLNVLGKAALNSFLIK